VTTPAVEFKEVSFSYGSYFSFRQVSFTVNEQEFFTVVGPNGGGKSTLIKLMVGLLTPTSGSIELFGKSPSHAFNEIAYVPQTLEIDRAFPITVREIALSGRLKFLPWWGRYRQEDVEAVEEALETVRLSDFIDQPFSTLSSGQAQRALIARALASKPKLLILDEPTASVDAENAQDIYALLRKLKEELTIVLVSHDLKTAVEDATKVAVVQKGVTLLEPSQVCEHFIYGLYHTPLIQPEGH